MYPFIGYVFLNVSSLPCMFVPRCDNVAYFSMLLTSFYALHVPCHLSSAFQLAHYGPPLTVDLRVLGCAWQGNNNERRTKYTRLPC